MITRLKGSINNKREIDFNKMDKIGQNWEILDNLDKNWQITEQLKLYVEARCDARALKLIFFLVFQFTGSFEFFRSSRISRSERCRCSFWCFDGVVRRFSLSDVLQNFPQFVTKFSAIRVAVLRLFLYQGELYKIQTRNGLKPFEM